MTISQIIDRQIDFAQVPPELAKLLHPLAARWEAAIVRVAETHGSTRPPTFPSGSIERVLQDRFSSLPIAQQIAGTLRVNRAMRSGGKVGERANRFLKVDMSDLSQSIHDAQPQATGNFQLSSTEKQEVAAFAGRLVQLPDNQPAGKEPAAAPWHSTLELRFRRMLCVDETNGFLGTERGSDEMAIGSTVIDTDGVISKIERVNLFKNWDDGDDRPYPNPKVIAGVRLQGKSYPLTAFVTMIMVEEDGGGFLETLINRIYDLLASETKDWIIAQLGTGFPPVLLGYVTAYLIEKIINKLKSYWNDDPFHPVTLQITLPSQSSTFNGKTVTRSRRLRFTGPGEYYPSYEWVLT